MPAVLAVVGLHRLRDEALGLPVPSIPFQRDPTLAGVTLVEPGASRRPGRTLHLRDGRILDEGVTGDRLAGEDGFAGRFVLPGLVDLHVHLPPPGTPDERAFYGLLFLLHGVTAVRDTGSFRGASLALAEQVEDGGAAHPRVFACGPFLDGEEPRWPGSRAVSGPGDAEAAVDTLVRRGAHCAKLYNGLDAATAEALQAAARERGLPVVAHVPGALPLASLAGSEVQHLMGGPNCWAWLGPAEIQLYVDRSRAHGITHTPTLVLFSAAARWQAAFRRPPLPFAGLARHWRPAPGRNCPDDPPLQLAAMRRLVGALHRAGVPIRVGTDTPLSGLVPGAALHAELAELVAAGLTPEAAWRAATRGAGEALGQEGIGRLVPGAAADLAIFREDPTVDLAALATLEAVVVRGRLYRRDDLVGAVSSVAWRFEGTWSRLYTAAVHALAALAGYGA